MANSWIRFAAFLVTVIPFLQAEPSIAAPFRYSCASAGGYFSEIEQFQSGPAYHIRGRFRADEFRSKTQWLPTATVALEASNKGAHVGVQLMRQQDKKQMNVNIVAKIGGERKTWTIGTVAIHKAVPFSIDVRPPHPAIVTLGGQSMQVPVSLGGNARISITCSSGDFDFHGLDWSSPASAQ